MDCDLQCICKACLCKVCIMYITAYVSFFGIVLVFLYGSGGNLCMAAKRPIEQPITLPLPL